MLLQLGGNRTRLQIQVSETQPGNFNFPIAQENEGLAAGMVGRPVFHQFIQAPDLIRGSLPMPVNVLHHVSPRLAICRKLVHPWSVIHRGASM
ncbi:hypothetical protein [Azohydromonas aeria]|uniref:hypothetical protein n=1 Tax=Azohydromonas aeria TaxID=2590212 RepID=UPI001E35D88F|nr:hypothetical protein [Azohydromonas aeria]